MSKTLHRQDSDDSDNDEKFYKGKAQVLYPGVPVHLMFHCKSPFVKTV